MKSSMLKETITIGNNKVRGFFVTGSIFPDVFQLLEQTTCPPLVRKCCEFSSTLWYVYRGHHKTVFVFLIFLFSPCERVYMVNLGKKCSNFIMKISSKKHIYILCVCKLFKQDKSIPCRGILKIVFQPKVYCLKMNTSFFIFLASIEYCV